MCGNVDAVFIDRSTTPTVPTVVPMDDVAHVGDVVPQVLPYEAVAEDAVAEYSSYRQRFLCRCLRRLGPNEEARPVLRGDGVVSLRRIGCSRRNRGRRGERRRTRLVQPSSSSSPPSTSLTLGSFLISSREI